MHVCNSAEKKNFLHCVGSNIPHLTTVLSKQLKLLHLPNIIHYFELLSQISLHPFLNHIASGHIPPKASLENHRVLFNHLKNLPRPAHPKVCLNAGGYLIHMHDSSANN